MQKMFSCKGGSVGDTALKNQKHSTSFLACFDLALILKSSIRLFSLKYFLSVESQPNYFFLTFQTLQWGIILVVWFLHLGANKKVSI